MGMLRRLALAALAVLAGAASVWADDYPTKPITIVVPYVSGGSTEILARFVGQKLEQRLGKAVVIEN